MNITHALDGHKILTKKKYRKVEKNDYVYIFSGTRTI